MRLVVVTVAATMVTHAPAAAEPCPTSTVMRRGDVATCDGILTPGVRVKACLTAEEDLTLCRVEHAAETRLRAIDATRCGDTIRALEEALAAEREAGRNEATPVTRTRWEPIALGVAIGVLVGAGVVGVVWATR